MGTFILARIMFARAFGFRVPSLGLACYGFQNYGCWGFLWVSGLRFRFRVLVWGLASLGIQLSKNITFDI